MTITPIRATANNTVGWNIFCLFNVIPNILAPSEQRARAVAAHCRNQGTQALPIPRT